MKRQYSEFSCMKLRNQVERTFWCIPLCLLLLMQLYFAKWAACADKPAKIYHLNIQQASALKSFTVSSSLLFSFWSATLLLWFTLTAAGSCFLSSNKQPLVIQKFRSSVSVCKSTFSFLKLELTHLSCQWKWKSSVSLIIRGQEFSFAKHTNSLKFPNGLNLNLSYSFSAKVFWGSLSYNFKKICIYIYKNLLYIYNYS